MNITFENDDILPLISTVLRKIIVSPLRVHYMVALPVHREQHPPAAPSSLELTSGHQCWLLTTTTSTTTTTTTTATHPIIMHRSHKIYDAGVIVNDVYKRCDMLDISVNCWQIFLLNNTIISIGDIINDLFVMNKPTVHSKTIKNSNHRANVCYKYLNLETKLTAIFHHHHHHHQQHHHHRNRERHIEYIGKVCTVWLEYLMYGMDIKPNHSVHLSLYASVYVFCPLSIVLMIYNANKLTNTLYIINIMMLLIVAIVILLTTATTIRIVQWLNCIQCDYNKLIFNPNEKFILRSGCGDGDVASVSDIDGQHYVSSINQFKCYNRIKTSDIHHPQDSDGGVLVMNSSESTCSKQNVLEYTSLQHNVLLQLFQLCFIGNQWMINIFSQQYKSLCWPLHSTVILLLALRMFLSLFSYCQTIVLLFLKHFLVFCFIFGFFYLVLGRKFFFDKQKTLLYL